MESPVQLFSNAIRRSVVNDTRLTWQTSGHRALQPESNLG